jgi:hypothetical protein
MACKDRESESSAALAKFNFHGDELDVVTTLDGEPFAVLARLCEPLGLLAHGQVAKLKSAPWACTQIICAHDESGRKQELFCVSLRTIPMWLASINAGKVAPHLRDKLALYQRECAEVLADHFLGKRRQDPNHATMRELGDLRAMVEIDRQENLLLRAKVELLDPTANGTIGEFRANLIRGSLREAGGSTARRWGSRRRRGRSRSGTTSCAVTSASPRASSSGGSTCR